MGFPNLGAIFQNAGKLISLFKQFMQNPIGAFVSNGINIPPSVQGNPEGILNYLRNSGRMSDEEYNQSAQAAQMAQNLFGKKF